MGRGYQVTLPPQANFTPRPAGNVTCCAQLEYLLPMKKWILCGALIFLTTLAEAQSPAPGDQKQVEALLRTVQAQQLQIAQNQVKIDAKLATLAESIRVAKIYASRGGR